MLIRDFAASDRDEILALVTEFYTTPSVLHPVPMSHYTNIYAEMCDGGSGRVRGLAIEDKSEVVGFCTLSFGYSTEAGGPVVLVEELYVKEECRGGGIGSEVLRFVEEEYAGKAARIRLEVMPDNHRAIELYKKLGFEELPYLQMVKERGTGAE